MSLINKIIGKLNLSPTREKVVRNIVWAVTGKVVTLLGGLLVGIFVARYLGPEQYGLMSYVMSYVALFQVFASFGMDNIEIREESKTPEEKDKIIGTAFGLKLTFAVVTMGLIALTAWLFEADSFTKWMIILYSISMIMNSFGVIRNYFTSLVWNEYIVKTEISRTLIGAGVKITLLLLEAPLAWFIAATLFDTILIAGGYLVSYRSKIDSVRKWQFDKETAKYLIKQSFPLLLSGAAIIVYNKIGEIMLGNMLDKNSVGYFSVASRFVEICIFIPTIISQTITPILVRHHESNITQYSYQTKIYCSTIVWCSIFVAVITTLLAQPLIRYTFGTSYMASVPILQVLSFKAVGAALMQSSGQMIIIEGLQKYAVLRNGIAAVICVLGNLIFIPIFGAVGAAISGVIAFFFAGYLSHIFIPFYRKYLPLQTYSIFLGWKHLFTLVKRHD